MKSLGQIAFDAYEEYCFETWAGRSWAHLTNEEQGLWETIAEAVEDEVRRRMGPEE